MYNRLEEVKNQHEHGKKENFHGQTIHPRDVDWLIEQAKKFEQSQKEIEELKWVLESCKDHAETIMGKDYGETMDAYYIVEEVNQILRKGNENEIQRN